MTNFNCGRKPDECSPADPAARSLSEQDIASTETASSVSCPSSTDSAKPSSCPLENTDEIYADLIRELEETETQPEEIQVPPLRNPSIGSTIHFVPEQKPERLFSIWKGADTGTRVSWIFLFLSVLLLLVSVFFHEWTAIFLSAILVAGSLCSLLLGTGIFPLRQKWLRPALFTGCTLFASFTLYSLLLKTSFSAFGIESLQEPPVVQKSDGDLLTVPFSARDCLQKNYTEIANTLRQEGFTKISYKAVEDLGYSQQDQIGQLISVSIDQNTAFEEGDTFSKEAAVILSYHALGKVPVTIDITFTPNLFFSKYGVDVKIDDVLCQSLAHGEDTSFRLEMLPGSHTIAFSSPDSSARGSYPLSVTGETNVSLKITCTSNAIQVEKQYLEQPALLQDNEIMLKEDPSSWLGKDLQEVQEDLYAAGFENIQIEPVQRPAFSTAAENAVESVSIDGNLSPRQGDIFTVQSEVILYYCHTEEKRQQQFHFWDKDAFDQSSEWLLDAWNQLQP